MTGILEGIIIGGAGGAVAGLTVYGIQFIHSIYKNYSEGKRVYTWFKSNTSNENGKRFRSTRAVASWNNLTEDRVRYLCSIRSDIYLSTGKSEDIWSIHQRNDDPPDLRYV